VTLAPPGCRREDYPWRSATPKHACTQSDWRAGALRSELASSHAPNAAMDDGPEFALLDGREELPLGERHINLMPAGMPPLEVRA